MRIGQVKQIAELVQIGIQIGRLQQLPLPFGV